MSLEAQAKLGVHKRRALGSRLNTVHIIPEHSAATRVAPTHTLKERRPRGLRFGRRRFVLGLLLGRAHLGSEHETGGLWAASLRHREGRARSRKQHWLRPKLVCVVGVSIVERCVLQVDSQDVRQRHRPLVSKPKEQTPPMIRVR